MTNENPSKPSVMMFPDKLDPKSWRVEAIDLEGDGDCNVAIFGGPHAEKLARQLAKLWQDQAAARGKKRSPPAMTAEETLNEIHKVLAHCMDPESDLSDHEAIAVITEMLERHGMTFVADDAFGA